MTIRIAAGMIGAAALFFGASAAEACGADVECKGDRICEDQICVAPPPSAPAVIVPPRAMELPPQRPADSWQYGVLAPPPRSLPSPVLHMRSRSLRNTGIVFVAIGVAMEIAAIALIDSAPRFCDASAPYGGLHSTACGNTFGAAAALGLIGFAPFIANGSWMWPVGGAMVPQDHATIASTLKPYFVATRDGGGAGLQLSF